MTSVLFKVPRAGLILGGFWVFTPRVRAQHATMGECVYVRPVGRNPRAPGIQVQCETGFEGKGRGRRRA